MGVGFLGIIEKVMVLPWVSPGFSNYASCAYYNGAVRSLLPSQQVYLRVFPRNLNSVVVKESTLHCVALSNQNGASLRQLFLTRRCTLFPGNSNFLPGLVLPSRFPTYNNLFYKLACSCKSPFFIGLSACAFKISSFHACILLHLHDAQ